MPRPKRKIYYIITNFFGYWYQKDKYSWTMKAEGSTTVTKYTKEKAFKALTNAPKGSKMYMMYKKNKRWYTWWEWSKDE